MSEHHVYMFILVLLFVVIPLVIYVLYYLCIVPSFSVNPSGVVVITGASTGIGRYTAEYLAARGYTVFGAVRKQNDADKISNRRDPNFLPLLLDVSNHASCVKAVQEVTDYVNQTGVPFVALVNNAGLSRNILAEFHDLADVKNVFDTNVFGLVDMVQLSMDLLRRNSGRVVNISSVSGLIATARTSIYSATKFAVEVPLSVFSVPFVCHCDVLIFLGVF